MQVKNELRFERKPQKSLIQRGLAVSISQAKGYNQE